MQTGTLIPDDSPDIVQTFAMNDRQRRVMRNALADFFCDKAKGKCMTKYLIRNGFEPRSSIKGVMQYSRDIHTAEQMLAMFGGAFPLPTPPTP